MGLSNAVPGRERTRAGGITLDLRLYGTQRGAEPQYLELEVPDTRQEAGSPCSESGEGRLVVLLDEQATASQGLWTPGRSGVDADADAGPRADLQTGAQLRCAAHLTIDVLSPPITAHSAPLNGRQAPKYLDAYLEGAASMGGQGLAGSGVVEVDVIKS
ncbi:hypothetical protein GGTG_07041 [Gaeumannomyces tritici R3-111a-1]|uniref:Uncharacterized protein n=1 Tax=Gaeumannomyces tritici (strain R3-111a-1) TaxID=644352 RepID=J3P0J6_GAET3|nr:hypothetical protein GGTG_07041 [Gaeumannomyces tritici R3-111a-1]EJT77129.1 hypothetical protein GGTG_07041 [Gaeumannomyces tritici R3-111a-1]